MDPSFGLHPGNGASTLVTGLVIAIVSGLVGLVIKNLYHRIETVEAALPARMKQYQDDQDKQRERIEEQLRDLRRLHGENAVKLSALEAQSKK